jgi:hypothetical protein
MRKVAVALVAVLVFAAVGLVPFQKIYDDGMWPLSVVVRSARGAPISAASAQAFGDAESAGYVLENLIPPESWLYSATREPFDGEAVVVHIPTSECIQTSLLWSYRRFYQYNKLVVIVRYTDGKREGQLVEIPDLRRSREVIVQFP